MARNEAKAQWMLNHFIRMKREEQALREIGARVADIQIEDQGEHRASASASASVTSTARSTKEASATSTAVASSSSATQITLIAPTHSS
jgi:hypothetical protein